MVRVNRADAANQATVRCMTALVSRRPIWPGWIPMLILPVAAIALASRLVPWLFMWVLAAAIFVGCKWQTWWEQSGKAASVEMRRSLGYLFAWPGMDAEAFLDAQRHAHQPKIKEWIWASIKTVFGGLLLWGGVRFLPKENGLLAGWVGMFGIILILHFGTFHLLSLAWRSVGVDAQPIMRAPLSATSLSDFWGRRWNLGFRQLTHQLIFQPVRRRTGVVPAILLSFFASGVIHDLVISLPALGGYGLPTGYFLLQGLGIVFERCPLGEKLGLTSGVRGWLFAAIWAGAPAFLLFHSPFVLRVILPFLRAMGAR
jgi:membrane bound O-acyltransferase family protein